MSKQTLHIFKPGKQTAMSGVTLEFSEADLDACAKAYDPAVHEAPIVVGHPRHDAPAYGWIQSLSSGADGLYAAPHQVDAAFAELVEDGKFKKVSASFYIPDAPNNPVPGVYYLRHLAFLGAQPPAVKGLKAVEFAEAEEGVISFAEAEDGIVEFGELSPSTVGRLFRGLRDFFLAKFGQEEADRALPPFEIDWLQEQIAQPDSQDGGFRSAAFTEPDTPVPPTQPEEPTVDPEKAKALENENQQLKDKLAALEAQAKADAEAARHADNVSYAEGLVTAGKLLPKDRETVVALMDLVSSQLANGAVLEFGEGDTKRELVTEFKVLLGNLPEVVSFGEHVTKDKVAGVMADPSIEFAEKSTDPERLDLHVRATRLASEKGIPYEQAARQLIV